MKKIILEKEEGIAEVIDQILTGPEDEIALVVPKGSVLGRSVSNFHLLKREASASGKTVIIESVDDTILAFAKQSNLESSHPLWRGVRSTGGISDIVPAVRGGSAEREEMKAEKPTPKRRKKKVEPVKLTVRAEEEEEISSEADESVEEEEEVVPPRGRSRRRLVWSGIVILVLVAVVFAVITWSFGRAAIAISFRKTPWEYQGAFLADKSVSKASMTNGTIPAQVFSTKKNTTQTYPASGSANVSLKAQGTITVYNAYSSAAQQLVATTRFVTPEGKIFRIVDSVTVPGASVTDGKIVPSSIDTAVVADQAGPAYNVGPVARLAIPGFQGTPKYDAFYGELKSGTSGGFIGTRAVPTAADIASARTKVSAALQSNLSSDLTTSYPNNFKILDGATSVSVTKLTVNTTTDSGGNFSVFGEATLQAIGFDESKFKDSLLNRAQSEKQDSMFDSLTLSYGAVRADFTKGTVSFSLSARGTLEPAFDADAFRASVKGKSIDEVRTAIAALPDLADGKISVWPRWLEKVPNNTDKIAVTTN